MTVVHCQPRVKPATAMRVLLGVTSKSDILRFCSRANVGVRCKFIDGEWVEQDLDIQWVMVPHNGNLLDRMNNDGDWIVQKAPGQFFIYTDTDFHREYVMA